MKSSSKRLLQVGEILSLSDYFDNATLGDVLVSVYDHRWTILGKTDTHLLVQSDKFFYPFTILPTPRFQYSILKLQNNLVRVKKHLLSVEKIDRSTCCNFHYKTNFLCLREGGRVAHLTVGERRKKRTEHDVTCCFADRQSLLHFPTQIPESNHPRNWIPLNYLKSRDSRNSQWLIGPRGYCLRQKVGTYYPTSENILADKYIIMRLASKLGRSIHSPLRNIVLDIVDEDDSIYYSLDSFTIPRTSNYLPQERQIACLKSEDFARMQVLDLFLNNRDRRGDNLLYDSQGRVTPVDFELCLRPTAERGREVVEFLTKLVSDRPVIKCNTIFPLLPIKTASYTLSQKRAALLTWRRLALLSDKQLNVIVGELLPKERSLLEDLQASRDLFLRTFEQQFGELVEDLRTASNPFLEESYISSGRFSWELGAIEAVEQVLPTATFLQFTSLDYNHITIIQEEDSTFLTSRNPILLQKALSQASYKDVKISEWLYNIQGYEYLKQVVNFLKKGGYASTEKLTELISQRKELIYHPVERGTIVELYIGGAYTYYLCKEEAAVSTLTKSFIRFQQPFSSPPEDIFLFAVKTMDADSSVKKYPLPTQAFTVYYAQIQSPNAIEGGAQISCKILEETVRLLRSI